MLKLLVLAAAFAVAVLLAAGVLTPSAAQNRGCPQYAIRVFDASELTRLQNVLDAGWEPFAATQGGVYARRCR